MLRFKRFLPIMGFVCLISYFAYHTFTGEQSVGKLLIYHQREAALSEQLETLQACRAELEHFIAMLSDQQLDLDFLEERARALLYMADADDIVIQVKSVAAANSDTNAQNLASCDRAAVF